MLSIKKLSYSKIYSNKSICKMILLHNIECNYDLYRNIIKYKDSIVNNNKLDIIMPFSILSRDNTIIGFIVEKEFNQISDDIILALDIVYILPEYRNHGYCKEFLIEYSKQPRIVIANKIISNKIIKIIQEETKNGIEMINTSYVPNFDINNPQNFVNGDKTTNWSSHGLQKKYRKN